MLLYYLTAQGYDRLSAGWNYENPNDPQNLANAYNLDRVLAGLVHTTPYAGTSAENWIAASSSTPGCWVTPIQAQPSGRSRWARITQIFSI